jgi:hypothetical protein
MPSVKSALGRRAAASDGKTVHLVDPSFDFARRSRSPSVEQRSAAVACPKAAQDVASVGVCTRDDGLRVSAPPTRHNTGTGGRPPHESFVMAERMQRADVVAAEGGHPCPAYGWLSQRGLR